MGKIVISTNISLDGVVQDPDGAEGFKLGGWLRKSGGKDLDEWSDVFLKEATKEYYAVLSGRWFQARSLDETFGDLINGDRSDGNRAIRVIAETGAS
jgi:hypothetical protein